MSEGRTGQIGRLAREKYFPQSFYAFSRFFFPPLFNELISYALSLHIHLQLTRVGDPRVVIYLFILCYCIKH